MSEQTENTFETARDTTGGMDINKKLIFNMRDLSHVMRSLYEGKASQKRILIILNEVKSITQRDLTMRLGIQPGSASEILSKLENAGLILRTMSETDRRTANLSLTEKGIQVACEAAEQRNRRHVEMFSCLTEGEKEELLILLEKVNADWTQRYGVEAEGRRQQCHRHGHGCGHGHGGEAECERRQRHGHGEESGCSHAHEHGGDGGWEHGHEGGHNPGDKCDNENKKTENRLETEETAHAVEVH